MSRPAPLASILTSLILHKNTKQERGLTLSQLKYPQHKETLKATASNLWFEFLCWLIKWDIRCKLLSFGGRSQWNLVLLPCFRSNRLLVLASCLEWLQAWEWYWCVDLSLGKKTNKIVFQNGRLLIESQTQSNCIDNCVPSNHTIPLTPLKMSSAGSGTLFQDIYSTASLLSTLVL